jgi:hypothetical protein
MGDRRDLEKSNWMNMVIEPTQMGTLWEIYDKCLLVYNWLTTVGF